jgi:hypothetical protein
MKVFLKKELYFEIIVEDGTDRNVVTDAINRTVDPAFNEFVRKLTLSQAEVGALSKLIGHDVTVRAIPRSDYLTQLNPKE